MKDLDIQITISDNLLSIYAIARIAGTHHSGSVVVPYDSETLRIDGQYRRYQKTAAHAALNNLMENLR